MIMVMPQQNGVMDERPDRKGRREFPRLALAAVGATVLLPGTRAARAFQGMAKKGGSGIERGFSFAQLVYEGEN